MTTANTRVKDNDRTSQAGPFAMGSGMVQPGKVGGQGFRRSTRAWSMTPVSTTTWVPV